MPIHAPHAHLYNSVKLEVAKAKLGHAGRKSLVRARSTWWRTST